MERGGRHPFSEIQPLWLLQNAVFHRLLLFKKQSGLDEPGEDVYGLAHRPADVVRSVLSCIDDIDIAAVIYPVILERELCAVLQYDIEKGLIQIDAERSAIRQHILRNDVILIALRPPFIYERVCLDDIRPHLGAPPFLYTEIEGVYFYNFTMYYTVISKIM